jgi:hypothetical protein
VTFLLAKPVYLLCLEQCPESILGCTFTPHMRLRTSVNESLLPASP